MKLITWTLSAVLLVAGSAHAGGPAGFGPVKLDMTKDAIEALQTSDAVYLNGPPTPYQYKSTQPKPGEDKFDALLSTPLSPTPLKAVLTFEGGKLTGLHLTLEDSSAMLERVRAQIVEKYGPGKVEDHRKEEQCVYKNGANFKLTSGAVSTKWIEPLSGTQQIETTLLDLSLEVCPSNLRYGSIGPVKLKSLSIQRRDTAAQADKPKNLF